MTNRALPRGHAEWLCHPDGSFPRIGQWATHGRRRAAVRNAAVAVAQAAGAAIPGRCSPASVPAGTTRSGRRRLIGQSRLLRCRTSNRGMAAGSRTDARVVDEIEAAGNRGPRWIDKVRFKPLPVRHRWSRLTCCAPRRREPGRFAGELVTTWRGDHGASPRHARFQVTLLADGLQRAKTPACTSCP